MRGPRPCFVVLPKERVKPGNPPQFTPRNIQLTTKQVNVFIDDMGNFAEMNGMYEKYFAHKPARSCVAVKTLPKNVPVEIECTALA